MSLTAHADYTAAHCIPYGVMHDLTNTHDTISYRTFCSLLAPGRMALLCERIPVFTAFSRRSFYLLPFWRHSLTCSISFIPVYAQDL
jgi:hypothetical protein